MFVKDPFVTCYARVKDGIQTAIMVCDEIIYPHVRYRKKSGDIYESNDWYKVRIDIGQIDIAKKHYCEIADIITEEEFQEIQNNKFIHEIEDEVKSSSLDLLETLLPQKDEKWKDAAIMILQNEENTKNNRIKIEMIKNSSGQLLKSLERYTMEEHIKIINEFLLIPIELFEFKVNKGEFDEYLDLSILMMTERSNGNDNKIKLQILKHRNRKKKAVQC